MSLETPATNPPAPQPSTPTPWRWIIFDWVFGVAAPILCLVFDPFVFTNRDPLAGSGGFDRFRVFAFVAIGLGTSLLAIWLVFGSRLGRAQGFFAGVLALGTLCAGALGLGLLPFSLLGLLMVIGVFGFTPFATCAVYLRQTRRAWQPFKVAPTSNGRLLFVMLALLGFGSVLALPGAAQWQTSRVVAQGVAAIVSGEPTQVAAGVQMLKSAFWCDLACYTPIIRAYRSNDDVAYRKQLAQAYAELTDEDLATVVMRLNND